MSDDPGNALAVKRDWRTARLSDADRALCAFAEKLTAIPARVRREDVDALRAAGFTDEAIHDAVQVISYFNYINRIAEGLGTDLEADMPPRPPQWEPPAVAWPRLGPGSVVTLEEVTKDNVRTILQLEVSPPQRRFVATNPVSLAQRHFHPHMRNVALCVEGVPVGYALLEPQPEQHAIYIVRFMIDQRFQGHGVGRKALDAIVAAARAEEGVRKVTLSYVPGDGSPREFYAKAGFRETGEVEDGENVMELVLSPA